LPDASTGNNVRMNDRTDLDADAEADRQLNELVQELRLVLPGTTVLFGFLLSLPFSAGADTLTAPDRVAYFVAFLGAGMAVVLLVAQAGYHRLRGKPYDKQVMIRTATHEAIAALVSLAISLLACVVLVTDLVYGPVAAFGVAIPLGVGALWLWFGLPLWRRFHGDPTGR
jgi:archaellum biogenesis protein FlaJ (TadC family)